MKRTSLKTPFSKRGQVGATLIELMAGVGVMAIVVTAAASLSNLVSNSARAANSRGSEQALVSLVRQRIESSNVCEQTVTGVNLPAAGGWLTAAGQEVTMSIPSIDGTTIAAGTVLPLQGIKVNSLRLQDVQLASACGDGAIAVDGSEECDSNAPMNSLHCTSACRCAAGYAPSVPSPGVNAGGICVATTGSPPASGNPTTEYIGKVYMQFDRLSAANGSTGSAGQLGLVGPLIFQRDNVTGNITTCKSSLNLSDAAVCTKIMGCGYDPTAPVSSRCVCPPYVKGCADPAKEYPVAVEGGVLICQTLGGSCPPDPATGKKRILTGIGVGQVYCMDEPPTSVPEVIPACGNLIVEAGEACDGTANCMASCSCAAGYSGVGGICKPTSSGDTLLAKWVGGAITMNEDRCVPRKSQASETIDYGNVVYQPPSQGAIPTTYTLNDTSFQMGATGVKFRMSSVNWKCNSSSELGVNLQTKLKVWVKIPGHPDVLADGALVVTGPKTNHSQGVTQGAEVRIEYKSPGVAKVVFAGAASPSGGNGSPGPNGSSILLQTFPLTDTILADDIPMPGDTVTIKVEMTIQDYHSDGGKFSDVNMYMTKY